MTRQYNIINIDYQVGTLEQLEEMFPWLKDCKFKQAEVYAYSDKFSKFQDNISFIWEGGIWEGGVFPSFGKWNDGYFDGGVFKGDWVKGEWNNGIYEGKSWKQGNIWVDKLDDYSLSTDDPNIVKLKYSNFSQITSKLKTNQFQTPKEIRSIKDPTLYSIADRLIRL